MDRIKERPILFSAPMVRALLDGSKTQTRRVVKFNDRLERWDSEGYYQVQPDTIAKVPWTGLKVRWYIACPHGQPGDRLWVRETWRSVPMICLNDGSRSNSVEYAAGKRVLPYGKPPAIWDVPKHGGMKWSPSIHMFRKDSRITLEITGVRVERLQDINRGDAMTEGCPFPNMEQGDDPRRWYADLWESLNGPGSWNVNPWVWVVEFKRVTA